MKKFPRILSCILLSVLLAASCSDSEYRYVESGCSPVISTDLSNNNVNSICEDSYGHIWIATFRGLNKYDGREFHQYYSEADTLSLTDNQVKAVMCDSKGRLWASTVNGPCLIGEDGSVVRVPYENFNRNMFELLESPSGMIIGNTGTSLMRYEENDGVFRTVLHGEDIGDYILHAMFSPNGELWLGCMNSLRCFNALTMTERESVPLEDGSASNCCMLPDGRIFISAYGRDLRVYNSLTHRAGTISATAASRRGYENVRISLVHPYMDGVLLYSEDDGLFFENAEKGMLMDQNDMGFPFKVPDFKISTLFTDSKGNLWIGSVDQGFEVVYSYKEPFSSSPLTGLLENRSVENVAQDSEGNVWICTMSEGLWIYDTEGRFSHADLGLTSGLLGVNKSEVSYVSCQDDGSVWVASGTGSKVFRCRYVGGKVVKQESYDVLAPMNVAQGADGSVWVTTAFSQVLVLKKGERSFVPAGIMNGFAPGLVMLRGGKVLVAAFNTPIRTIDPETFEMQDFQPFIQNYASCIKHSLFIPTDILEDSVGDIWVGTVANGLLRYDAATETMAPVEGAPCDDIEGILEDNQGNIWVSTQHGLGRWDRQSGKFVNYFKVDGIGGNQFYDRSRCRLSDGSLVFGGTHGITCFNPLEVDRRIDAPLVFETLKIHNRLVEGNIAGKESLAFKHDERNFSIGFAALDYSEFNRLHYHYCMEGHDVVWIDAQNNNEAYYGNIKPGRYTFRVRATQSDNETVIAENSMGIRVKPAPLASWWAICIYALLLLALAFIFMMFKRRIDRERETARKAEEEKEQERRVNKMNMDFFANVSHEFRTPLTMIAGPVKMLREENADESTGKSLGIIERNVHRMLRLVNQMLDFNKLENDTLKLKVCKVDVIPYLEDLVDTFRQTAESKDITLEVQGLQENCELWVDEDKLDKICYNLLSNAIKYTPRGGTILFEFDMEGADEAIIRVSDNGPGIPEEYLEKIFERYYQLDSAGGSYNLGTGIGLYYARSLANIHHGSLTASNRSEGSGAIFTLKLPAREEAYAQGEKAESGRDPRAFATGALKKLDFGPEETQKNDRRTIMIVDDDIDVAHYLKELLSPIYNVVCRFDVDTAFTTLREEPADLVMSDVMMPGKTGYELCRMVKGDMLLSHIPVILVTAKTAIDDQVEGLNCGADAYVTKPFDPNYLLALLQSQLSNREKLREILASATRTGDIGEQDGLSGKDKAFMDELFGIMESELGNSDIDITRITEKMKISRTKLYYKTKGLTGENPSVLFKRYKLNRAAQLLREHKYNMSEIADMTGFATLSHFSTSFKKQFGVPPSEY